MTGTWFTMTWRRSERVAIWAGDRPRPSPPAAETVRAVAEVVTSSGLAARGYAGDGDAALGLARRFRPYGRPSCDAFPPPMVDVEDDVDEDVGAGWLQDAMTLTRVPWTGQMTVADCRNVYANSAGTRRLHSYRTFTLRLRNLNPVERCPEIRAVGTSWPAVLASARAEQRWRSSARSPVRVPTAAPSEVVVRGAAARTLLGVIATAAVTPGSGLSAEAMPWLVDDPTSIDSPCARPFDDLGFSTSASGLDEPWWGEDGRLRPGHASLVEGELRVGLTALRAAPGARTASVDQGYVVDDLEVINDCGSDGLLYLRPRTAWWLAGSGQPAVPAALSCVWQASAHDIVLLPLSPAASIPGDPDAVTTWIGGLRVVSDG